MDTTLYYLNNFQFVIDWVQTRYADLLTSEENDFCLQFKLLPEPSKSLLVRMLMRKGVLFRKSKLNYAEIPDITTAVQPLLALNWVSINPEINAGQLWQLLLKSELETQFKLDKKLSKKDMFPVIELSYPEPQSWQQYLPAFKEPLYQLEIQTLCDYFRLMFFGNLYQELTEFVITDLGIFNYEKVTFSETDKAFKTRQDIDAYYQVHQCNQMLDAGDLDLCLDSIPEVIPDNPWLVRRKHKLLYKLAYQLERNSELVLALSLYEQSDYQGSRVRQIRILVKQEKIQQAWELWQLFFTSCKFESDKQALIRMAPRLALKAGETYQREKIIFPEQIINTVELEEDESVEERAAVLLSTKDCPVFYVENRLLNSLFGLWCWEAVFHNVEGAFFHPYQMAPADLNQPDFVEKRQTIFDDLWQQLESNSYVEHIQQRFIEKQGITNSFVNWSVITSKMLNMALECITATELKLIFKRILFDIRSNRSGLPDLVQFDLVDKCVVFIEVKGPGDKLQDNQIRWFEYFQQNNINCKVCYVRW